MISETTSYKRRRLSRRSLSIRLLLQSTITMQGFVVGVILVLVCAMFLPSVHPTPLESNETSKVSISTHRLSSSPNHSHFHSLVGSSTSLQQILVREEMCLSDSCSGMEVNTISTNATLLKQPMVQRCAS